ncbi:helix-turn-helix transcriptional regulator [Paenibacillus ginsengarvi]|uniref:AraC family transcriptional regulator n=1 Tax=Paenibacillus ginsengarvi TaxID=400777 RepID=A0A3B0BTP2_9BACL|nr:AraC family transcriptional regulator [Paenibacillus ginsengarvi]RKN75821.1 AraC family transcriptional regulator [Paenibacillus ginsengarvi]
MHWHDHLEWVYVRKGRVSIQVDAFVGEAKEGELVFVNSRQLHAAHPLEPDSHMAAIVFNEALLRNSGLDSTEERYILPILTHRLKLPVILRRDDPLSSDILGAVSRLIDELDNRSNGYELFVKAELYRIFGLIFRHHRELAPPAKTMSPRDYAFNELLQTIRGNIRANMTVEEAARAVNLSPHHFCTMFKKMTGKTLIEYVHLLRINEAERLLKETDRYITEIAEQVGFNDITYFGRIFRKYRSMSPTELRKNIRST